MNNQSNKPHTYHHPHYFSLAHIIIAGIFISVFAISAIVSGSAGTDGLKNSTVVEIRDLNNDGVINFLDLNATAMDLGKQR